MTGKSGNQIVGGYAPKQGGGLAFTNAQGQPVSAATFATQNNLGVGDLLYRMGQSGDQYAQQAYNQIKSNQGWYNSNPNALKSEFSPLFWGV